MATTANQTVSRQEGDRQSFPAAASTSILEGTLVFLASGYAAAVVASGANRLAGIAIKEVDNSAGSAGDLNVEVWRKGVFRLTGSGFSQASVGKKVYASDNYTLTLNAAGATYVGVIEEYVSATVVGVRIDPNGALEGVNTVVAAGSAQGDAADLTGGTNVVTGGDDTKGVVLPTAVVGGEPVRVLNSGSAGLKIYPAADDKINNGSANAAITILENTLAVLYPVAADNWAAQFTVNS